jgi:hypothetical protein
MCVLEQSGTQAQVPLKKIVATAALLLALVIVPRLISAAYMESAGVLVTGKVVAKREAFLMPGGDKMTRGGELSSPRSPGYAPAQTEMAGNDTGAPSWGAAHRGLMSAACRRFKLRVSS